MAGVVQMVMTHGLIRWVLIVAGVGLAGCSGARLGSPGETARAIDASYPKFSWATVPQWGFLSIRNTEELTDAQVRHVADSFPILTLCKHQPARRDETVEDALLRMGRRVKAVNPDIKLLYYWNTTLAMDGSAALRDYAAHPEWGLLGARQERLKVGKFELMDPSNGGMREWWSDAAARAVRDGTYDGVFADAVCKYGMGQLPSLSGLTAEKKGALAEGMYAMLCATRDKMGPGKLLVYNGLRGDLSGWRHGGARYLDCASGALVEHFAAFSGRDEAGRIRREQLANDIELIGAAARRGKLVLVKGWPSTHSWMSPEFRKLSQEERLKLLKENLTFPLAAYLVAAEAYCYFDYSLGYLSNCGIFEKLEDLHRPLGPPKGPARREGWVYTRAFERASVWLDIEHEQARIDWR